MISGLSLRPKTKPNLMEGLFKQILPESKTWLVCLTAKESYSNTPVKIPGLLRAQRTRPPTLLCSPGSVLAPCSSHLMSNTVSS